MMGGYSINPDYPKSGIDFNSGTADTLSLIHHMAFFATDASICDTTGQLLFYTNGVYVANRNHDTLMNSQHLNDGFATSYYGGVGLGFSQGAVIVPKPGNEEHFYIFYITDELIHAHGSDDAQPLYLSYSEVDMSLDGGLGGIVSGKKNIHIVEDT